MALLTRRTGLVAAGLTVLGVLAARKRLSPASHSASPDSQDDAPALTGLDAIVPVVPPTPLAAFSVRTLDGATKTIADYPGRIVVLNFWATWCVPCVAELPALDRLAQQGAVTVLAVSADRGGAAVVRPFAADHAITHATLLLDPGQEAVHALGIAGFPTTLILGPDGRLHGRLEGPAAWSDAAPLLHRLVETGHAARGPM